MPSDPKKEMQILILRIKDQVESAETYIKKKNWVAAENRVDEIENLAAELSCFIHDERS